MSAELEDVPEGTDPRDIGLINKYVVYRTKGHDSGMNALERVEEPVFVLKPHTDPKARVALLWYANECTKSGHLQLANDLMDWIERINSEEALESLRTLAKNDGL